MARRTLLLDSAADREAPPRRSSGGWFWKLLLGAGAAAAGLSAYAAYAIHRPRRRDLLDDYTVTPFELQTPHKDVEFITEDDVKLRGWLFENPGDPRVVIGASGRWGSKADLIGIGTGLWRAGFNVLLFDCRGRGESEAARISAGYYEQRDFRAARNFVRHTIPGARIGLLGYSLGAAVAILAAAEDPRIRGVVADSPFASLGGMIAHYFSSKGLPGRMLASLAAAWNQLLYGYSLADISPEYYVADIAPRPLLLIHGEADSVTPLSECERIYEAAGVGRELWIAEGAEHCGAYFVDRAAYIERVAGFFEKALSA